MDKTRKVSLKALFLLTCFLKVSSSAIGWVLDQPWTFGLILPLAFMLAYIFIGYRFRERDVSAEKFADSCYYLGFIFTIVSIIFSLIDIPNIGNDMTTIAVRFGAAMASTVFGLFVRVLLVSFRPGAEDALDRVEDQVVDSARRLTDEFDNVFDELRDFRGKVSSAARETVALVDDQFETLAQGNMARTHAIFDEMSKLNRDSMQEMARELRAASTALARFVGSYENSLNGTLARIEKTVDCFSHQLIARLRAVEFPDDLFSRKLEAPISSLNGSTETLTEGVRKVSIDVLKAARAVESSVGQINLRTEDIAHVLHAVHQLNAQQERIVGLMKAQQESLASEIRMQQESVAQDIARQTQALAAIASACNGLDASIKRMHERNEQLAEQARTTSNDTEARLARLTELTERFMSEGIRRFDQLDALGQTVERLEKREARPGDDSATAPLSRPLQGRQATDEVGRSSRRDAWSLQPSIPAPKPD